MPAVLIDAHSKEWKKTLGKTLRPEKYWFCGVQDWKQVPMSVLIS